MSVVRSSTVVDARPEDVWGVVADPRNLPRWNAHIRAVHNVPQDGLRAGSTYTTELRVVGVTLRIRAKVLEVDPPRSAVVRLRGPVEAVVRTWVRPLGRDRAILEHEVDYRFMGGPLGELVAKAVRYVGATAILKRGVRAQKEQVERG